MFWLCIAVYEFPVAWSMVWYGSGTTGGVFKAIPLGYEELFSFLLFSAVLHTCERFSEEPNDLGNMHLGICLFCILTLERNQTGQQHGPIPNVIGISHVQIPVPILNTA